MRFQVPFEQPKDRFSCTPDRTLHGIRSSKLAASGSQNRVGEGSRQNRSVTLGKGVALRIGFEVLVFRFELLGSCLTLRGVE